MTILIILFGLSALWYIRDTAKLLPQICVGVFSVGIIAAAVISMAIKAGA